MEAIKKIGLIAVLMLLAAALWSCGGGGDGDKDPTLPDPANQGNGGDFDTPRIIGEPQTPFAPIGDVPFNDLRGVAVSSRFVYIADATSISMYRTNGQGIIRVPAPYGATVQGIAVFPEQIDVNLPDQYADLSPFAGLPVVLHNPVPTFGYVTIMPPNLDISSTIEDAGNLDLDRLVTLPNGGNNIDPPGICGVSADWNCVETIDIKVDPFGSILATTKIVDCFAGLDPAGISPPRVGLQIFNRFRDYTIEYGGVRELDDDIDDNPSSIPTFHKPAFGNATGSLGNIAIGNHILTISGINSSQYEYQFYTGDVFAEGDLFFTGGGNFLDFVGRTRMRLNLNTTPPTYNPNPLGDAPPYYDQVFGIPFGETFASQPGNPTGGGGIDPDLTAGGPSGLFCDPRDGKFYACDPGNDRILVYDAFVVDPLLPTLIGDTQQLDQIITLAQEPSEVMVDEFGRTFICDFNDLRIVPGSTINTQFGNVGGTVRHADLGVPIVGATVTFQDEFSVIAVTQTNINGDYLFNNAPYGQYMMTASKFNYGDDSWVATIVPDNTIRVDFNLKPNLPVVTGNYLGVVFDNTNRSFLADVIVSIVGTSLSTTTDANGEFKIPNLADGSYQVVFEKTGYSTVSMDVVISSGENTFHPSIIMSRL